MGKAGFEPAAFLMCRIYSPVRLRHRPRLPKHQLSWSRTNISLSQAFYPGKGLILGSKS